MIPTCSRDFASTTYTTAFWPDYEGLKLSGATYIGSEVVGAYKSDFYVASAFVYVVHGLDVYGANHSQAHLTRIHWNAPFRDAAIRLARAAGFECA